MNATMTKMQAQDIDAGSEYFVNEELCKVTRVSSDVASFEYVYITLDNGETIALPYEYPVWFSKVSDLSCSKCRKVRTFAELEYNGGFCDACIERANG